MTMPLPECRQGKLRKCFHPKADGITGLHAHYNSAWQPAHADEGAKTIGIDVYRRIVLLMLEQEKLDGIVPIGFDHNVCPVCQTHMLKIASLNSEIALKETELAQAKAELRKQQRR